MNIPYSIKRKAAETGALGHHQKLERIMENSEIEALISCRLYTKSMAEDIQIGKIVRAWLERTLERHREKGDL